MGRDVFSAIIYTGFGLFYLASSLKYSAGTLANPGPGLFPKIIAIVMFLCGLALLKSSLRGGEKKERLSSVWEGLSTRNITSFMMVIGSVALYLVILNSVGFLLSSALLVLSLAWAMGGGNLFYSIVLGIVSSGLTYWLFWVIMRVPIPQGSLWGR
jgi:putative tricarboxylic transport membrane protein